MNALIQVEHIEHRIFLIRDHRVILDTDLCELYKVQVSQLTRQVRRNPLRFPPDFCFQLTKEEWENLKCHFGISSSSWGGRRHPPYVFTEQGVGMAASVLKSERAALMNVAIVRAFVRLRQMLATHKELAEKLSELEKKLGAHDAQIHGLFEAIRELMAPTSPKPKPRIGYRQES